MGEFSMIWAQIQNSSTMQHKFNEENINISGMDLRRVMKQSAKFGIENYQRLQQQCVKNWNYHNAFFFARLFNVVLCLNLNLVWNSTICNVPFPFLANSHCRAWHFAGTLATTIGYGNVVPRTDKVIIALSCLSLCCFRRESIFNYSSITHTHT